MKTTLRQQIKAVGKVYNHSNCAQVLTTKEWTALNDAASTLAAVNLIGRKRIELLPELIEAAKGVLPEFDSEVDAINAFNRLKKVLKKMS